MGSLGEPKQLYVFAFIIIFTKGLGDIFCVLVGIFFNSFIK